MIVANVADRVTRERRSIVCQEVQEGGCGGMVVLEVVASGVMIGVASTRGPS